MALTSPNTFGQSYLVNMDFYTSNPFFGNTTASTPYIGAGAIGSSGDYWNGIDLNTVENSPNQTATFSNLKTANGNTTGISFMFSTFNGYGGGYNINESLYGPIQPLTDPDVSISGEANIIGGLTPNAQYNLYLISGPGAHGQGISVNGVSFLWSGISSDSYSSLPSGSYAMNTVTANANGQLDITAPNSGGGNSAYLSSLQLTPEATPEPSILTLTGLGAASLLAFRRRK